MAVKLDLKPFGIFSPTLGIREDIPSILLEKAFNPDNCNIKAKYQFIERERGRLKKFIEAAFAQGTVSVTNGSPTATLSDTGWASATTHKPHWVGRSISITDSLGVTRSYTISAVTYHAVNSSITLSSNYAGATESGRSYSIGTVGTRVQTPDGFPILRYHLLTQNTGTQYCFVFTKAHIYLWSDAWSAFILKFTNSSNCTRWSSVTFNNAIVVTNNVDKVQTWGSSTSALFDNFGSSSGVDLGGSVYLTAAQLVFVYENYLFFFYTTEGGTVYPHRERWGSYGTTDFDITGTGDTGSNDFAGTEPIVGVGTKGGMMFIFKKDRYYRQWLVETDDVWNNILESENIGCVAPESIVNDSSGNLFWFDNQYNFREMRNGVISFPIDITVKLINPGLMEYIKAGYMSENDEIWWSVPYNTTATTNDKILKYRGRDINGRDLWGYGDSVISAFGLYYVKSSYTIDTIPFPTIETIGWQTIDNVENTVGWPQDLVGDYSGYTCAAHSAETDQTTDSDPVNHTGYFVLSTDLSDGQMLQMFKRVEGMYLYVRGESTGTLDLSVKRDNETDWQTIGSVDITGDEPIKEIYVGPDVLDHIAKHFLWKFSADNRFRFFGVIFEYILCGERNR